MGKKKSKTPTPVASPVPRSADDIDETVGGGDLVGEGGTDDNGDAPRSILGGIIKQLSIGMDLSRVTLPTFILEPRSLLEKFTDQNLHAGLLFDGASLPCATRLPLLSRISRLFRLLAAHLESEPAPRRGREGDMAWGEACGVFPAALFPGAQSTALARGSAAPIRKSRRPNDRRREMAGRGGFAG